MKISDCDTFQLSDTVKLSIELVNWSAEKQTLIITLFDSDTRFYLIEKCFYENDLEKALRTRDNLVKAFLNVIDK